MTIDPSKLLLATASIYKEGKDAGKKIGYREATDDVFCTLSESHDLQDKVYDHVVEACSGQGFDEETLAFIHDLAQELLVEVIAGFIDKKY